MKISTKVEIENENKEQMTVGKTSNTFIEDG